jgi:arginine/lysine/ornithine decarboxylase
MSGDISSQNNMPLVAMLKNAHKSERVSFHIPGHNRGASFSREFSSDFSQYDTTELSSTDDINNPSGGVAAAQTLAAKAFGAGKTFFITTGSSSAIRAVLRGVVKPGEKIILMHDIHVSVINACIANNLCVIFSSEDCIPDTLSAHQDAVAVWITRPDYYGRCCDIRKIALIVRLNKALLIVDEAHGSHFAFSPSLYPVSALRGGADIVVQSAYKTLPALTQGSMIHLSPKYFNQICTNDMCCSLHEISESIFMETTSSPSFLIAASLDFARHYMIKNCSKKSKMLLTQLRCFFQNLDDRWMPCFNEEYLKRVFYQNSTSFSSSDFDFTRLVFQLDFLPFSTLDLVFALEKTGIYIEFYDFTHIVLICKFDHTDKDYQLLAKVLNEFIAGIQPNNNTHNTLSETSVLQNHIYGNRKINIYDYSFPTLRKYGPSRFTPLAFAVGKILASCIVPYPPGIPLVLPYDRITPELVQLLRVYIDNKWMVRGIVFQPGIKHMFQNALVNCYVHDVSN